MIARLTQWRPLPGLGHTEALEAWVRHAAAVDRIPGLRRYVQHHTTVGPDGAEPEYAGLGEIWFDDAESAGAALASPEWAAVIEDAETFMDLGSVVAAWTDRTIVREP